MTKTYAVHVRRTFLAADELGAISVFRYHRAEKGWPSFNQRVHMTQQEADEFLHMQLHDLTETQDIVAGRITTYTITKE